MENKEFKLNEEYYLADGTKVILCGFGGDDKVCITERIYVCEEFEDDYSGSGEFESDVNGRTYLIEKNELYFEPPITIKNETIAELDQEIKKLHAKAWNLKKEVRDLNYKSDNEKRILSETKEAFQIESEKLNQLEMQKTEIEKQIKERQDQLIIEREKEFSSLNNNSPKSLYLPIDEYLLLFKSQMELNSIKLRRTTPWCYYDEHLDDFKERNGKSLDDVIAEKRSSLLAAMEQSNA